MTVEKLTEMLSNAKELIENIQRVQYDYTIKINDIIDDLEKTINNASENSTHFVETKIKKLSGKLNKILEGFNKKVKNLTGQLNIWYDTTTDTLKLNIIKKTQAMFGIELPEAAIKKLAEAIPVPPLVLPEIKIELPDLSNLELNGEVKLKRIPLIEIPGLEKAKEKLDNANEMINDL